MPVRYVVFRFVSYRSQSNFNLFSCVDIHPSLFGEVVTPTIDTWQHKAVGHRCG